MSTLMREDNRQEDKDITQNENMKENGWEKENEEESTDGEEKENEETCSSPFVYTAKKHRLFVSPLKEASILLRTMAKPPV